MRRLSRVSLLVAGLLLSSVGFWSGVAEAAGKRIGVAKFEGAQEALVRKKVMSSLKSHGFELVRSRDIADAASRIGASLDTDEGLQALAKELALSAIVTGEVGPKRAKIVVHDGGEGSILGDASFNGANPRKLAAEVGLTFWKKLGPDVGRGHVPSGAKKPTKASEASPEDDENASEGGEGGEAAAGGEAGEAAAKPKVEAVADETAGGEAEAPKKKKKKKSPKMEEEASAAPSAPPAPTGLPWLDFELGVGGLNRSLTWHENVSVQGSQLLLPYTLGVGPVLTGNVVIYLEPLIGGPVGNIGLESHSEVGFGISSTLNTSSGSVTYTDVVHDFSGGARYRFPFAGIDEFHVGVTGGEDAFTFNGRTANPLNIPDTIYHYVRPGIGLRLASSGGLSVTLNGGYRYVFNQAGPQFSGHYFPRLTVGGADAEAVVGYALGSLFEVRAGLQWRRYWFTLNSQAGDNYVAGGATDQYFTFTARIAIVLGASDVPKSEGGTAEEAPPPPPPPSKNRRRKAADEETGGDSDSEGAAPSVESDAAKKSGGDE
jgi:hypothetical protein